MSNGIKIRKHAPYRKSYLIPIWVIQLGLSTFLVCMAGFSIAFVLPASHFSSPHLRLLSHLTFPRTDQQEFNPYNANPAVLRFCDVLQLLLNLATIASIIYIIVKFSRFALTTKVFKIQSIFAVVAGAICIILYSTRQGGEVIFASWAGAEWLASVALCARVCVLRRRVKRGEVGEMKRRTEGEQVEERVNVELQDGNKFRVIEEVGKARPSVKVVLGGENGKSRPSFNSEEAGILSAPEKVAREFV